MQRCPLDGALVTEPALQEPPEPRRRSLEDGRRPRDDGPEREVRLHAVRAQGQGQAPRRGGKVGAWGARQGFALEMKKNLNVVRYIPSLTVKDI